MNSEHQIIFYSGPEGETRVEVFFLEESLWLSQKRMAELFGVEVNTISYHLKEIFKSGELDENAVIRNSRITAIDGKNYPANHLSFPRSAWECRPGRSASRMPSGTIPHKDQCASGRRNDDFGLMRRFYILGICSRRLGSRA
jgi:hypothetical protein